MPELAVVIVSWNVRKLLKGCLRTLLDDIQLWELDAEVWVVDNASEDGSPEMVAEAFPTVHLIANSENLGFAAANNLALRQALQFEARGPDFVWFLNPDTEVHPGATSTLVSVLRDNPDVGIVGPKLLYGDGSLQQSAFRFPGLTQLAFDLLPLPDRLYDTRLNGRYPSRHYSGEEPFEVDHLLGAAMMVRMETILDVGLMDESFWMYCEEVDWCWRMKEAGWRALCVPAARVIHHAGESSGQRPAPSFVNLWTSRAQLYSRHHGALKRCLASRFVRSEMRRRLDDASSEMESSYKDVIRAWEEI